MEILKRSIEAVGCELNITEPQTNFDWLVKVVYNLRNSQGFYNILWKNLCSVDMSILSCYIDDINSLDKFNDTIDVIMILEG